MSDLQIGLAMLGVVVVGSVLAFNWWQERKFRRRAEESFSSSHEDILLERQPPAAKVPVRAPASAPVEEEDVRIEPRIEPMLQPVASAPVSAPPPPDASPEVDYVAEIRAGEQVPHDRLVPLQQSLALLGRKAFLSGFDFATRTWGGLAPGGQWTAIRIAVQLVDRSGPVTESYLQQLGETLRQAAHELSAIAELPEFAPALEKAAALDEFCAEVDVAVGINVIAHAGQVFHGTKIRALAEASGFQLRADGVFHLPDDHGGTQFLLDNQESAPFLPDKIRNLTTPGITFLLDVPRTADGLRTFDRMVAASRSMAESLDGTLADDNRVLLNDTGLDKIRGQLRAIYAAMEARGIAPGSALALRLFS
jgi:hypothetical protein